MFRCKRGVGVAVVLSGLAVALGAYGAGADSSTGAHSSASTKPTRSLAAAPARNAADERPERSGLRPRDDASQRMDYGDTVFGGPQGPIVVTDGNGNVCATGHTELAVWYDYGVERLRHYSTCGYWLDDEWSDPYWACSDYKYFGDQEFVAQWPPRGYGSVPDSDCSE
ncbi:MAG TPA: hypothetical protein VE570_11285 [Thermoleophilaceae bacterium]|jgi:hypothetical protein|nr:hypothetical protein [Thermoleophilaceae bacterium]